MTYSIKGFESTELEVVTKEASNFINSPQMKGQILDGYAIQTAQALNGAIKYIIVVSYFDEKEAIR